MRKSWRQTEIVDDTVPQSGTLCLAQQISTVQKFKLFRLLDLFGSKVTGPLHINKHFYKSARLAVLSNLRTQFICTTLKQRISFSKFKFYICSQLRLYIICLSAASATCFHTQLLQIIQVSSPSSSFIFQPHKSDAFHMTPDDSAGFLQTPTGLHSDSHLNITNFFVHTSFLSWNI